MIIYFIIQLDTKMGLVSLVCKMALLYWTVMIFLTSYRELSGLEQLCSTYWCAGLAIIIVDYEPQFTKKDWIYQVISSLHFRV